jgi:hypothetical protein
LTTEIGQVAAIIGAGILLVLAAYLVNETVRQWLIIYRLRSSGIQSTALIAELRVDVSGRAARHFISFTFKKDEHKNPIHIDQQVNSNKYREFEQGQKVKIRYLSSNPNVARLAAEDADNSLAKIILFISVVSLILFPPLILVAIICLGYRMQSRTWYK